jgi:hypothetical protein
MTDILAHQIVARNADDLIASCITEAVQDLGHPQSNRRFASSRITRETHMQGGWFRLEPELTSRTFDEKQRGDLSDACFDRCESDKLVVKLIKCFSDARLSVEIGKIDALGSICSRVLS